MDHTALMRRSVFEEFLQQEFFVIGVPERLDHSSQMHKNECQITKLRRGGMGAEQVLDAMAEGP